MEAAGFTLRNMDVRDRAGEILRLNHGHNSPYREGSPGHNWLGGFIKRHPGKLIRTGLCVIATHTCTDLGFIMKKGQIKVKNSSK